MRGLLGGDVTFILFERQIRHASDSESFPVKIIYFLKYETMSGYVNVLGQDRSSFLLYVHDLCNADKIIIYVIRNHGQTSSPNMLKHKGDMFQT